MTALCLTIVIYFEARGVSLDTQHLVAKVVLNRAAYYHEPVCKTITRGFEFWKTLPRKRRVFKETDALIKATAIGRVWARRKGSSAGRIYFNECRLGKRFATIYRVKRSDNLCFY